MRMIFTAALALFAGCASGDPNFGIPPTAPATSLVNSAGQAIGTVRVWQSPGGVTFAIDAHSLPPGLHGIHVHEVGRCDAPSFDSAGAHWNPARRQHGLNNPQGPHAGDMPNVTVAANGVLREAVALPHFTFAELRDADGASVMIHAGADDYVSDPSGNSGARIACAAVP